MTAWKPWVEPQTVQSTRREALLVKGSTHRQACCRCWTNRSMKMVACRSSPMHSQRWLNLCYRILRACHDHFVSEHTDAVGGEGVRVSVSKSSQHDRSVVRFKVIVRAGSSKWSQSLNHRPLSVAAFPTKCASSVGPLAGQPCVVGGQAPIFPMKYTASVEDQR